jgi:hypothetical protein
MKTFLLLFSFLLGIISTYAQYKKNIVRTENVLKLNFLSPGVSYEAAINKNQTLYSEAYLAFAIRQSNYVGSNNSAEIEIVLIPALNLEYRYYYNYENRKENDKRTEKNSMNYIAPAIKHIFSNKKWFTNSNTSFGFLWGMQRNYSGHFSLNFSLGLGYAFSGTQYGISSSQKGFLTGIGDLRLGFWLNPRKEKE